MASLARGGQAKGTDPVHFVAAPRSWPRSLAALRRRAPIPCTSWPLHAHGLARSRGSGEGHQSRALRGRSTLMASLARGAQAKGTNPVHFVAARSAAPVAALRRRPLARRRQAKGTNPVHFVAAPRSWPRSLAALRRRAPIPCTSWPLARLLPSLRSVGGRLLAGVRRRAPIPCTSWPLHAHGLAR